MYMLESQFGQTPKSLLGILSTIMPKMKTHKAAAKRIRVTRRGKLIHAKGSAGHLQTKKSHRVRRASTKRFTLSPAFAKRVRALLRGG